MITSSAKAQSKPIAVLSNEIAKSSYNLTLMEHRVIKSFIAAVKFSEVLSSDVPYYLGVREFANFWNLNMFDVRKEVDKAVNTMFLRYVSTSRLDGTYTKTHWISSFTYDAVEDRFEIYWTPQVIGHISQLRERFVKLDLSELIDVKSMYSFRLYEILTTVIGENSYRNPSFTIEQLMHMMDVPDSCKEYKIFKQRVLMVAVGELKTKVKRFSKMEIEEEKEKRKVLGIKFCGVGVASRYKVKSKEVGI